jgi:hypothetical protein
MQLRPALAALAVLSTSLQAQLPLKHPPAPTVSAITAADLMTRLYLFADDSMLGREAGTMASLKGTDYIARELARLGLEPGGDNGGWFQDIPLERTGPDPSPRLSVGDRAFSYGADFLIFPPAAQLGGLGARFEAANVPIVYGGRLGDPALIAPEAAAGKLILFQPADGPGGWQFWARFGPQQWARFAGARGFIIAALETVPDPVRGFLTGAVISLPDTSALAGKYPVMFVSRSVAEALMGAPLTGLFAGTEGPRVTAVGGFIRGPSEAPGRNVVAIIRGSDPALRHQYVAFGAHNDHDGIRTPAVDHDSVRAFSTVVRPEGAEDGDKVATPEQLVTVRAVLDSLRQLRPARLDSVMNGADDDGSGSMALLELAEFFAKNPARRSLLFVWHTAEEKGLFGSEWYTDRPSVARDSIVAQLNMDMIGRGAPTDLALGDSAASYLQLIGSRRLSTQLGDLVEQVNASGRHGFVFDYQYDANGHPQQYYCRSDHYSYARYGIPVVFFSTGSHRDYHMVTDEPQYIDYSKYARVTSLIMDVGRTIANLDQRVVVDGARPAPGAQCVQ